MLPSFHFFGIHIPMYALMVFTGAVAYVIYTFIFVFKKEKYDMINRNRLLFVSIIGFATLGISAFIFNSFFHSLEKGKIFFGGITWLGGVIGVIPLTIFYIHKLVPRDKGNSINRFSTLFPGLVIAHAFGRLGCFFGGCCYGARTDGIFGVSFPAGSPAGKQYPDLNSTNTVIKEVANEAGEMVETVLYPSLPVLPTQLFEAVFELVLFVVMIALYKKVKNYQIEIYCFAYGLFRFLLEFARGDNRGVTGFFLTPSQLMSIILWIIAICIILYRKNIIFKKIFEKSKVWQEEAKTNNITQILPIINTSLRNVKTIRELHTLMKDGIITEEEFNAKKEELLKRI